MDKWDNWLQHWDTNGMSYCRFAWIRTFQQTDSPLYFQTDLDWADSIQRSAPYIQASLKNIHCWLLTADSPLEEDE